MSQMEDFERIVQAELQSRGTGGVELEWRLKGVTPVHAEAVRCLLSSSPAFEVAEEVESIEKCWDMACGGTGRWNESTRQLQVKRRLGCHDVMMPGGDVVRVAMAREEPLRPLPEGPPKGVRVVERRKRRLSFVQKNGGRYRVDITFLPPVDRDAEDERAEIEVELADTGYFYQETLRHTLDSGLALCKDLSAVIYNQPTINQQ